MSNNSYFGPEMFKFFSDLEKNNNRGWFAKDKERYEKDVKEPMLAFIEDFEPFLASISKNFVADPRPSGGSMFRIYRDTRFSKDKSPYKSWVAAKFNHRAQSNNVHAPGFYLHLQIGDCVGGGGLWHPEPDDLAKVRDAIVSPKSNWKEIKKLGLEIEGDSLVRPPQGYEQNHPFIGDLKRKDHYTGIAFTQKQVTSPEFMEIYYQSCKKASPLIEFLTRSLRLPW